MKKLLILLGAMALTFTLATAEGKCGNSQKGMMNNDSKCGNSQQGMMGKCDNGKKAGNKCDNGKCDNGKKAGNKCDNGKCDNGKKAGNKCDSGEKTEKKAPPKGKCGKGKCGE